MEFEFDPAKSQSNRRKHGIDFVEAQALWESPRMEVPLNYPLEERWLLIGRIAETHWTAVITYRGNQVRIISVRRSRKDEVQAYGAE